MKTRMEYTCPLELTHDVTKGNRLSCGSLEKGAAHYLP